MKRILTFSMLIFSLYLHSQSFSNLISDFDFTNQNYSKQRIFNFFTNFPSCKLTMAQKGYIYAVCHTYEVNPIFIMVQMEKEASLIRNKTTYDYPLRERRALGYACWIKKTNEQGQEYRPFEGYDQQLSLGVKRLRVLFNEFKPGMSIKVLSKEKIIYPENAATYAMYVYTPFYGEAVAFGHNTVGNRRFLSLWYVLKPIWDATK